jgi:glycosyltransferase involved in cell wall biosynthesis
LLGLVAIEGMASGKPVVVTKCTSLPELVVDGVTGFVVPPRDPATLREKVRLLISNPGLAERMGEAARRHVQQNLTWDKTASRALEFYRELAARGGRIRRAAVPTPAGDAS